jgi:hypothetical protein
MLEYEIEPLFRGIDVKNDNFLDYYEWMEVVAEESI